MDQYFKYIPKKYKNKNNQSQLTNQKTKYTSYKDNVLQFSLNAINNILINNLNSTINIGMLSITNNNFHKNHNQIMNKNLYINSLNDCIDYKIKGNIYKISQDNFLHLYPNMSDLITNNLSKHKKELKILKFDREILTPQTKTPTKEVPQHFYFNLMKNKNTNYDQMTNNIQIKNSKKISNNLEIEQKTKKINKNNNNCMYRISTTINSKEKNKNIVKNIRNTYKKKISPVKQYIISKTNTNSKENSIEKKKQNIIRNSNHNSPNSPKNELIYKTINNKPRKLIIYTKNGKGKEKSKIINSIKNNNIHKYIRTDLDLFSKSQSNNSSPKSNNNKNINFNNIEPPKTERNINYNENKSRLLLTPNKYIKNSPKNKENVLKNKNLNIPYNPTISNNINRISPKNSSTKKKNNLCLQSKLENNNYINKYAKNYYTINNDNINDNEIKSRNIYIKNKDNNIYDKYKTYVEYNDFSKRNNVFNNDNNNIFKILDNTQIITPDDCGSMQSSSMNSNKLHHFSGSNGNNTNQETDYNSLKKFNDLNGDKNNNYNNIGIYESEENFSFNNL
jgi:hypothetical protein